MSPCRVSGLYRVVLVVCINSCICPGAGFVLTYFQQKTSCFCCHVLTCSRCHTGESDVIMSVTEKQRLVFIYLTIYSSIYIFISLSIFMSDTRPLYISIYLSIWPPSQPSIYLFLYIYCLCMCVCVCACVFVCVRASVPAAFLGGPRSARPI